MSVFPGKSLLVSHLTEPAELLPSFVPMGAMVTFKVRTENGSKASQCPTRAQEGAQGARATTIDARPSTGYLRLCSQTNKAPQSLQIHFSPFVFVLWFTDARKIFCKFENPQAGFHM